MLDLLHSYSTSFVGNDFRHVEKLRIIVSCFVKSATDIFKSLEQNQRSYQLQRQSGIALMKYSKGIKLTDPYAFAPPPNPTDLV